MKLNISKKTKIIATIGPSSDNLEMVEKLYDAGMNVMRINFSHGKHEEHIPKINIARELEKKGIYVPVALDTKGPEIRTGMMEEGAVKVETGQRMIVSMEPVLGNEKRFSVTYSDLINDVKIGDHLLIDDGNLDFEILGINKDKGEIEVEAKNAHVLKNQKGVNCPFSRLSMPYISERDESDLKFGCENNLDAIFASFTRRKEDILAIKEILKKYGKPDIPIFAKIENPEGVAEIENILDVADGIMVARGDLGVEIPPEDVPNVQRRIIEACNRRGKPVITATQMLDSMVTHPRPTRAEVGDVANAVDEGSDCVMLSAESAAGKYPVEAVEMQAKIARTQERFLDYERLAQRAYDSSEKTNNDAISNAVANTANLIGAKLIVSFTETGKSTNRISKSRPCCPIISVTNRRSTAMNGAFMWGVYSVLIKTPMPDFIEEMEVLALKIAREVGIKAGDPIILVGGTPTGAGKTNFLRIISAIEVKEIA